MEGMYKKSDYRITILGARGSVPVSGAEFMKYGGATSSVLFETPELEIVLDAGTGILKLPYYHRKKDIHLFLSHYHLDHVIGLPMCPVLFDQKTNVTIYTPHFLRDSEETLKQLFRSPFWPVEIENLPATVHYKRVEEELLIGETTVRVSVLPIHHPNGGCAYRFDSPDCRIVYVTDCEPDEDGIEQLRQFSKDSDLLILDAQYTSAEYQYSKGFGHTTAYTALKIMSSENIGRCILFHHAPEHTDEQLDQMEREIQQQDSRIVYAKERMSITL